MRGRARSIDYSAISDSALSRYPQLPFDWLPKGRVLGHGFVVGKQRGDPGTSLKIDLETGLWKDIATGEGGRDPARFDGQESRATVIPQEHLPEAEGVAGGTE